jgi:tripartite ATP-independent transporter DctP family solute receptor
MRIDHAFRLFACSLATVFCCLPTGLIARDFRAADIQSPDYPTVRALGFMARLVAERTNGRHSISLFPSSQLGEEMETIEQTRVGAIDINRINIAPLASVARELRALGMPFLFRSDKHLHDTLDGPIGDALLESLAAYSLVGLAYYDSGARSIYNSQRPIRTIADLKGLRIRVQQSDMAEKMIRAMGAEPVALSYGQVPTALATGLIDGAENNWPSYVTTGHYKIARYYTATEHSMAPEVLVMSKKAWDSLDATDQRIFRAAAKESSRFMHDQWLAWEARSRKQAAEAGNVIIADFVRDRFEASMAPIYDEASRDLDLRAAIDRIRALP